MVLRPTRKTLFAVEAVLDIAYNAGPNPVQSQDITRRQGIPRRYLEQVLQQLGRAGILTGTRGPRGGYRLARERRRITVGAIVRAVQNADSVAHARNEGSDSALGQKIVQPLWDELEHSFLENLDTITIQDLCQRARLANVASEGAERLDYSI